MFGLGLWEIVAICLVGLVFVRPEELPKLMRKLARWYTQVSGSPRRMWQDLEATARAEAHDSDAVNGDESIGAAPTGDVTQRDTEEKQA